MRRLILVVALVAGCGDDVCETPAGVYNVVATPISDACEIGGFTDTLEFDGDGTTTPPEGCARSTDYAEGTCGFFFEDTCSSPDGPYTFRMDVGISDDGSQLDGSLRMEFRFPDGTIDCVSTFDLAYSRI